MDAEPVEPAEADPQLSLATAEQLFDELGRRFPEHVFAGTGPSGDDGAERWTLKMLGGSDSKIGLATRLRAAVQLQMMRNLRAAEWSEDDAADPE